jgi:Sulfotransferase family
VTTLPNFFVVGAGKSGTTSLYHYLRQHPQIYMSPVKEPCYFADEIRGKNIAAPFLKNLNRQSRQLPNAKPLGWIAQEWEDYAALFRDASGHAAIGEATAAYLWSATAAANIRRTIPAAKIIMILRDPAERAFSHYLHQLSTGYTRRSFRAHLHRCLRDDHRELSIYYPFLEAGLYAGQVQRFLDLFPRDRVRIYWYEEAWRDARKFLEDLFTFLQVDPAFAVDTSRKTLERRAPRFHRAHYYLKKFNLWTPMRAAVPASLQTRLRRAAFTAGNSIAIDPADRQFLINYYRPDIERLSTLLDRDLNSWLT